MAQLSDNDINEAKRRVLEMKNRTSKIFEENQNHGVKNDKKPEADNASNKHEGINSKDNNEEKGDKSFLIILSLIIILSQEEADKTLIFALLYLLL